ncbi:TetR/AcrR family transcriptional regulator [Plantactinospora sp. KBS50]|uniref:TetR/AcrR family transcriptional regulator n=1 Tax=Plantactinospora sp. KBS50 TaxID=2024580 RepID=UPI000BAB0363|nr:TetR/AcrR family transcriptional regulator [Plantactinospora sp. KBS50]ASW55305.1 TetR family transcriptional regulator [Plantactinospora sp. KBS50]
MGKGDQTRQAVLDQAVEVGRRVGLGGLTIGSLAEQMRMSKSGLFAHFRSKEGLQVSVLEHARTAFEDTVARPAIRAPRGEPRLRELFERWLVWAAAPGGCPFIAAAVEFDDQPGPVRDRLVRDQRDMLDMIATIFRTGIAEGHFRPDADPDQFAQDFDGVLLAFHHLCRLFGDERAESRARRAFGALLDGARPGPAEDGRAAPAAR